MKSKFQFKFCRIFWLFFQGVRWQPQFQASCPMQQYPMVGRARHFPRALSLYQGEISLPEAPSRRFLLSHWPEISTVPTSNQSPAKENGLFWFEKKKLSRIPGFSCTEMELSAFYSVALTNYNESPCTGCIMQTSWDSDKH